MLGTTNSPADNHTGHADHHHHDGDNDHGFIAVFFLLAALFICCGNAATLVAILRNHKLRTIPNIYIGSLAVADFMVGVMLLVQGISELQIVQKILDHQEQFCLARMSMLFVCLAASMLSYLLVACDRYVYIMQSLKYVNIVTKQRSLMFIVVAWMLACVYGTVPAYTSHFTPKEGCSPTHVFSDTYMIIVHPTFFLTLSAGTCWLYFRIVAVAIQQQKRIREQEFGVNQDLGGVRLSQRTWKVVKILMLVFGLFFLCWLPLLVLAFVEYTVHVDHLALDIASLIAVMNSGVNFLVLAAMKKDFRAEFRGMMCTCCGEVCCCCGSVKVHPAGVSTVGTSQWGSSAE
ncbi:unnamed protein product [Candidula unifasciata]|uniref:G-protein coupled receptors family 1 profile domain-containing protein n=1 Tax=Candidula unifasciata TaxID=100452 RepID=A0A8S3YB37_9EUPU|nr:unnamed protein product [Candidula unifasciata]